MIIYVKQNMPYESHIIVITWMMTYLFSKKLGKEAELLITIQSELSFFKLDHNEPLILDCMLPIVNHMNGLYHGTLEGGVSTRRYRLYCKIFCVMIG